MLRVSLTDLWIDSHFRYVESREDNDAYCTESSLWLGIGNNLTDIRTIGPYLSSVRVDVLRVSVTGLIALSMRGKISQESHILYRVYTERYCRQTGIQNLEWSSYLSNRHMRNLFAGLHRNVCLSRNQDHGQSKREYTWYDIGDRNQ